MPRLRLRPRGLIPGISCGREPSNSTGGTFTRVASGFSGAHLNSFTGAHLRGGFLLKGITVSTQPMVDPIGRPASARTVIIAATLEIELQPRMSDEDVSVSIYHEVLEAAAVAAVHPPSAVLEVNEADFESAAHRMHALSGPATVESPNRMLEMHGF